jgi:hypothetical protein
MLAVARILRTLLPAFAASALVAAVPAHSAEPAENRVQTLLIADAEGELGTFFAYHGPLWSRPDGSLDPAADALVALIETARIDGFDPEAFGYTELAAAVRKAELDRSP